MPISIQDYMDACSKKSYSRLNLASIDFSEVENQRMVAEFCFWLQSYPSVTYVHFMDIIRGGHAGIYLGRINQEYLVQIFNAIHHNSNIQRIDLDNCHLEEITNEAVNAAIGNCLASKATVKLTGNKNTHSELSLSLLLPLARGTTTDLEIGFIKWRGGEEAFFTALLTACKDKVFERIALVDNTAMCSTEQLQKLFATQVTILNLSNNMSMLSELTLEEWQNFITTIEENRRLCELSLKATDMRPYQARQIPLLQALQTSLLKWVRTTHLEKLDISENCWDEEFITQLEATVIERDPSLPKLNLLYRIDECEEIYGLEDGSSSNTTATLKLATTEIAPAISATVSVMHPILLSSRGIAVMHEEKLSHEDATSLISKETRGILPTAPKTQVCGMQLAL